MIWLSGGFIPDLYDVHELDGVWWDLFDTAIEHLFGSVGVSALKVVFWLVFILFLHMSAL